jgi:hypothetical protein
MENERTRMDGWSKARGECRVIFLFSFFSGENQVEKTAEKREGQ